MCYSFLHPIPLISTDVTIQLESLSFVVYEEDGDVEVCVNISAVQDDCPIEFDAGITLSTRKDTAGTIT